MSGTTLVYNDADFRLAFPFFANATTFPEALLSMNFTNGTNYISDYNAGFLANGNRQYALYLMTAHLTQLGVLIAANNGAAPMIETQATVDKISVTVQPPPQKNQWQYWLNLTPWGAQLLALLQVASAGGWYVGGLPERAAFRRVGGGFGGLGFR
jgi:hypothetical protein